MVKAISRVLIAGLVVIVVAACGETAEPEDVLEEAPDTTEAAQPSADTTEAMEEPTDTTDAEEAPEPTTEMDQPLRIGYASDLDPADLAGALGVFAANAEITELTEDSAVIAGLLRGDLDVGNVGLTEFIKASQAGAPLTVFYTDQLRFEFVLVTQQEIESLDDLAGTTLAYHAPGSGTEILPRQLVRQHDPDLEDQIEWTVLPESPNRAAAMLAGRIDATALEYADVLTLEEEGDFNIIATWGDLSGPSSDAISTVWISSEQFFEPNRERLLEFTNHLENAYADFYADKDAWLEAGREHLPDVDEGRMSESYDYYNDIEMYATAGEPPITQEKWESLDGFFREIGEYEDPADPSNVAFDFMADVAGQ